MRNLDVYLRILHAAAELKASLDSDYWRGRADGLEEALKLATDDHER